MPGLQCRDDNVDELRVKIAIVGPGLIGRSVALAARRAQTQNEIVEVDRDDSIDALAGAAVIVLATPVDVILERLRNVSEAFPDAVVRHDPAFVFTAVASGAARFAGGVPLDDFIYHDYALAVQNPETHTVEYELLVPRRTRYPTTGDFAVRYYGDYAGMNEMRFRVCEVGRLGQAPVAWQTRPTGVAYWSPPTDAERALSVELNPGDALLPLRPAGTGASPRLRVTYSVNADRWLCTTVEDLVRKQPLRENEPVVRLR